MTCDREPFHLPGAIQPHGVPVAVDDDQRAVMVSANLEAVAGAALEDPLRRQLADLVGEVPAKAVAAGVDAGLRLSDLDAWLAGLLAIQDTTPDDDTTLLVVRLEG
jgi:light-regulated signal transduction histidine kinase (bacteriophytochrome)